MLLAIGDARRRGSCPSLSTASALDQVGDLFAVVYLLLLGTVFLALAGLDTGTAFGGMGASREMTIAAIAEPTILVAIFALSVAAGSSNLGAIVAATLDHPSAAASPASLLAFAALVVVTIAETGRLPVDNPTTHLELTMIHEAMILEYSGPDLALVELAAHLRLVVFLGLLANLFLPWGIATTAATPRPRGRCGGRRASRSPCSPQRSRSSRCSSPRCGCSGCPSCSPPRSSWPSWPSPRRSSWPESTMSETAFVQLLDLAAGLVLVTSFAALWLRRLVTVTRVIAIQGFALAAVAAVIGLYEKDTELVAIAVVVGGLRGLVLPGLIIRAVRSGDEHREVESLINVPASLLAASGLTLIAYATTRDVVSLSDTAQVRALPLGVAVALIGILLIVSRRKAVLQILGVLMLDNGIALVMFLGTSGVPLAVELGIASDVLLAVFILQVLTNRIRHKFGGTDLDQLRELRD